MNEKLRRLFIKNPLIPVAVVLLGSVWFAMSILAFCVGLLLPWTKTKPPQQVTVTLPPRPGNGSASPASFIIHPAKSVSNGTSILMSRTDAARQHVSFPDAINIGEPSITPRPKAVKRWSLPAGYPSSSPVTLDNSSLTSLGSTGSSTLVSSLRNYQPRLSLIESGDGTSGSESQTLADTGSGYFSADSRMSEASTSSVARKNSLTSKLPLKVFRRRSTKGKEDLSGYSSTSPMSTPPRAFVELKPEERDTAISGEMYRSSFVSPFKFRPKRSSASATMVSDYNALEKSTKMPGKFEDSDCPTPTSSSPPYPQTAR